MLIAAAGAFVVVDVAGGNTNLRIVLFIEWKKFNIFAVFILFW